MIWNFPSIVRKAMLILLPIAATGCGWFGGNQSDERDPNDYLQAQPEADLEVPVDLPSKPSLDPFPVPQIAPQINPSFYPQKPPLPDAMYANDNRNEVRIQRLGARAWLAIPEPPTTAWPKIKQFFADNGVAFDFEDPEEGRLNTAWLSLDAQAYRDVVRAAVLDAKQSAGLGQGKDRLLIRVEQGLQPTATEVHLRHDNDQQGSQIAGNVAALNAIVSDLNDAESKLLSEIGAYIAARVAESTVSRVAQEIGSGAKTGLVRNAAGQPMLRLFLDRGRAWATLGQSLRNAEVVEVDVVEQSSETFSIQVVLPQSLFGGDKSSGVLCRLTFSCSGSRDVNVTLRMIANPASNVFDVLVFDGEQPLADNDLAQQILVLVREYAA
ncbi:MAG TPA: hypothetical protein DCL88_02690 [Gammaproteobacteria bacterium]|nr:hypothetical protein [Gammaproteobacteria bacterium]